MSSQEKKPLKGPRAEARLAAVQFGYQWLTKGELESDDLEQFWQLRPTGAKAQPFAQELIAGVLERAHELDALIEPKLEHYSLARISAVEHSILRVILWEAQYASDPAPKAVLIDQALGIAQKLVGSEGARFVHALLDTLLSTQ